MEKSGPEDGTGRKCSPRTRNRKRESKGSPVWRCSESIPSPSRSQQQTQTAARDVKKGGDGAEIAPGFEAKWRPKLGDRRWKLFLGRWNKTPNQDKGVYRDPIFMLYAICLEEDWTDVQHEAEKSLMECYDSLMHGILSQHKRDGVSFDCKSVRRDRILWKKHYLYSLRDMVDADFTSVPSVDHRRTFTFPEFPVFVQSINVITPEGVGSDYSIALNSRTVSRRVGTERILRSSHMLFMRPDESDDFIDLIHLPYASGGRVVSMEFTDYFHRSVWDDVKVHIVGCELKEDSIFLQPGGTEESCTQENRDIESKLLYLREFQRFENLGYKLTRAWNPYKDSKEEMRYELERLRLNYETANRAKRFSEAMERMVTP